MENNPTTFTYKQTGVIKEERATMITESRIEHVESLLKRAKKFESTAPKWDVFKTIASASAAIFLTIMGIIIPIYLDKITVVSGIILFVLWVFLASSAFSGILSFLMARCHDKNRANEHESYVEEMSEIVKKLKEGLDGNEKIQA